MLGVGGMGERVPHLVGVSVVCGDEGDAVGVVDCFEKDTDAVVYGFNGGDGGF